MLSRELQLRILKEYASVYPQMVHENWIYDGFTPDQARANVFYLSEHGLIEAKWNHMLDGGVVVGALRISAKGMDFLQDDGGLGAILGVLTVRLHDDTIRALLIQKVQESDEPDGVKARLVDAIKSAPAETLKTLTQKAVEAGIQSLPNAVQLLQGWLANG